MTNRFRTIVADPPWPIVWRPGKSRRNGRGERHGNIKRDLGYRTMSIEEIVAVPVYELAEFEAHLYLWTTDRFLLDGSAARVARAWGFDPRRLLVWKKSGFGLGTFPRPQHECCVVAVRGSCPFKVRNVGSVQNWGLVYRTIDGVPRRWHSAKPEGFFSVVESASPGPYLELFARKRRPGWAAWGDEVASDVSIAKA